MLASEIFFLQNVAEKSVAQNHDCDVQGGDAQIMRIEHAHDYERSSFFVKRTVCSCHAKSVDLRRVLVGFSQQRKIFRQIWRGFFRAEDFYQHRERTNPKIHETQIVVNALRHERNFIVERRFHIQNRNARQFEFSQKLNAKKIRRYSVDVCYCVRNNFRMREACDPSGKRRKIFYRLCFADFEISR